MSAPSQHPERDADWLAEGALIVHATFGTGTVVRIGEYKGVAAVWIDFDRGDRKILDVAYSAPYIRVRGSGDLSTAPRESIRCDVCGTRPVVATVASPLGTEQFCENHLSGYSPAPT